MTKLTFFHQKRRDAAVRTGIEVNDEMVLSRFTAGTEESNSALLWYIDVRCASADSIPVEAPAARAFFYENEEAIKAGLRAMADELRAGMDADLWPLRRPVSGLPEGVTAEVVCSATKRITDGDLSRVLTDLASHWHEFIEELNEPVEAVH